MAPRACKRLARKVPARVAPAAPPLPHQLPADPAELGLNGDIYTRVQVAWQKMDAHDAFKDLATLPPLGLDGEAATHGFMKEFTTADFTKSMTARGVYSCGCNVMWAALFYKPCPGVPLLLSNILKLKEFEFNKDEPPARFPTDLVIGVDSADGETVRAKRSWLKRLSPEEPVFAALLKISEGIDAGWSDATLVRWRRLLLTVPTTFELLTEPADFRWRSIDLREKIVNDFETMSTTAIQKIFEIASYKVEFERVSGTTLSAEAMFKMYEMKVTHSKMGDTFTKTLVDTALTCWNSVLSFPEIQQLLIKSDEDHGKRNVWDSVYKIEYLAKKAGKTNTVPKILWMIHAVEHLLTQHGKTSGEMSVANLSGKGKYQDGKGTLDICLYKLDLKDHLLQDVLESVRGMAADEKELARKTFDCHTHYKEQCCGTDLTWLGQLSKPARTFFGLIEDNTSSALLIAASCLPRWIPNCPCVLLARVNAHMMRCCLSMLSVRCTRARARHITLPGLGLRRLPRPHHCASRQDSPVGERHIGHGTLGGHLEGIGCSTGSTGNAWWEGRHRP